MTKNKSVQNVLIVTLEHLLRKKEKETVKNDRFFFESGSQFDLKLKKKAYQTIGHLTSNGIVGTSV